MAMKSFGLLVGLAVAACAGPAGAWPSTAYTSGELPLNRSQCLARAQSAMAAEAWGDLRPSGSVGWRGHKGPSSAYVLCLDAPVGAVPPGQAGAAVLAIVFVATTAAGTVAADEAARLQQRVLQQ
jgi:hypothetical protein